jgi:hypothetical protein
MSCLHPKDQSIGMNGMSIIFGTARNVIAVSRPRFWFLPTRRRSRHWTTFCRRCSLHRADQWIKKSDTVHVCLSAADFGQLVNTDLRRAPHSHSGGFLLFPCLRQFLLEVPVPQRISSPCATKLPNPVKQGVHHTLLYSTCAKYQQIKKAKLCPRSQCQQLGQ